MLSANDECRKYRYKNSSSTIQRVLEINGPFQYLLGSEQVTDLFGEACGVALAGDTNRGNGQSKKRRRASKETGMSWQVRKCTDRN